MPTEPESPTLPTALASQGSSRRGSWLGRLRDTLPGGDEVAASLPTADEVALATVLGGLAAVLVNAVAIALTVPRPTAGVGLRLEHHLFDLLEISGLGAAVGLFAAAVVGPFGRGRRLRWLAWLALGVAALGPMLGLLGEHLEREAVAVWDGRFAAVLYPLYLALCCASVPAAYALGAAFAPRPWQRWVPVAVGLGGSIAHHALLRDDYPGVHATVQWVAGALLGAALARPLARQLQLGRRRRRFAVVLGAWAALALVWSPPNAVRLELFREPGSVGALVLATSVWTPPALSPQAMAAAHVFDPTTIPRRHPVLDAQLPAAPVVVLISIEATRADVLEGAHDADLPELRKLRDGGAYFPRSISPGSQTSVSLTTLFTGHYMSELYWEMYGQGAMRFLYAVEDPHPRFPELLGRAGVETADYLGLIFLSGRFGVTRGFAEELCAVQDRRHALASEVLTPLLKRLGGGGRKPFFAYAHVMEPHEPYDRGKLKEGSDYERYISEEQVVDLWIGRIARVLRQRYPTRGYLIVTGDHGEAFGEHGTQFHSKTLYEELVRVPLVVWGPGIVPRRHAEMVGHVDLGPTILELFGQPVPPDQMGQSLVPLLFGQDEPRPRPMLAEGRLRRALFRPDGLKVIDDTRLKTVEVYDLNADPGETRNLFDSDQSRVEPAVAELRAFFDRYAFRRPGYHLQYKR
jgi:hypothetical protein